MPQADIKEVLPHTALLFSPPAAQVAPINPLVPDASPGSNQQQSAASDEVIGNTSQARQAADLAAHLDDLASKAVTKLRERSERELDLLAEEFEFQPQQKILAREVQARAVQVLAARYKPLSYCQQVSCAMISADSGVA